MKKKALRKDFYMEIRKKYGAVFVHLFYRCDRLCLFAGIRSSEPDMRYSGDAYFDRKNLMDLQVISTMGLTDEDVGDNREAGWDRKSGSRIFSGRTLYRGRQSDRHACHVAASVHESGAGGEWKTA